MFKKFAGLIMCLGGLLLVSPASGGEPAPLRLAVHPYASTLALINTHRPLAEHLSASLGQKVEFYTAPSFEAFIDTLMSGGYDIVISPPHFAVMAMDKSYVPLVHYQSKLEPLLVVRTDSPIRKPSDFRGKRIAMADKTAFIRIVAVKWLAENGLVAGRDYEIVERPSHGATVAATVAGEADAGLATDSALRQLPPDLQEKVRSINTGLRFPHLFTMAHRRLGDPLIARINSALFSFPDTEEGRKFMERSGFRGYEKISDEEVRAMKPYVEMYREMNERR